MSLFDPTNPLIRRAGRIMPALWPAPLIQGVRTQQVENTEIHATIYSPENPRGAVLWIHGGGLLMGHPRQDVKHLKETAAEVGVSIIAPRYRFAPENPYPAALDDVHSAYHWLLTHAEELGIRPDRIVIGGQSAGGGLAAALCQRLHDEGGLQPAGQWLFCPMLDDRAASTDRNPIWDADSNAQAWRFYVNGNPDAPYAVPGRRADLSGLPPAWLYAGSSELFYGEIVDYAERLRTAGVPTQCEVVDGGVHAFELWAPHTAAAKRLLMSSRVWLQSTFNTLD
ncbi:alpha/beta hydrolase [Corynebacterium aurimucosum]|uniref:Putative esterase n=1 Tax=Corynebacterium aurimucosum (strain ATCC 700975 / DSM 44827 / CIP 107346 / CN-1) TaxID=548476 RepID=C3PI11_CORA7|nr:alpha/beta hydrolase [Corynebacterium aurimucosum]ACP33465.1 putative esterase [Corynebacterium aurimucosum ATCC 700975]QQU92420.1 alpha/beta hydrolase [Corynebacterium aurimucosum]